MHILHLNQRNQRNQILFQYLRDKKKKKGAQKKGGENSPISPPLDPRLRRSAEFFTKCRVRDVLLAHELFTTRLEITPGPGQIFLSQVL